MSFLKQTLKNTASLLLAVGIIGTAYAAITTVNSGDPLTADAWNEIVNKITNTDTNSTDLVTKAYVDNTVSAAGGSTSGSIDWNQCEHKYIGNNNNHSNRYTCTDSSYAVVAFNCTIGDNGNCYITGENEFYMYDYYYSGGGNYSYDSQTGLSFKCCKVNP